MVPRSKQPPHHDLRPPRLCRSGNHHPGIINPFLGTPFTINEYDMDFPKNLNEIKEIVDRASDGVALCLGEEDVMELQTLLGME